LKSPEQRLGLLAGAGRFPIYLATVAKAQGYKVIVVGPKGRLEPDIDNCADKVLTYQFGHTREVLKILKEEEIKKVVMAGKVDKRWLYEPDISFDDLTKEIFSRLSDRKDDTIMNQIVKILEEMGIEILPSIEFIRDWLAPQGSFSAAKPSPSQKKDIEFGFKIAKEIGRLDIGQTIAVLNRAVLAVEAIDGTDLTIIRAGQISPGAVVVKILKPGQSLKFDVPVVGKSTIQSMIQANAAVLAVEAGSCLVVEREEMQRLADQNNIALYGIKNV